MLLPALLKLRAPKMKARTGARPRRAPLTGRRSAVPPPQAARAPAAYCVPAHLLSTRGVAAGRAPAERARAPTAGAAARAGGLVPAHALPEQRDLPHAAGARGGAARGAQGGPHRLPHVRLRAALCVRLHAHPGPRGARPAAPAAAACRGGRRLRAGVVSAGAACRALRCKVSGCLCSSALGRCCCASPRYGGQCDAPVRCRACRRSRRSAWGALRGPKAGWAADGWV